MNATTHALSINPANGETVGSYPYETTQQLDAALERATLAFRTWRRQPVSQRAELLLSLASALREQAEDMAQMITLEMGKPIAQARAEIEKCAQLSEWYAAMARPCSPRNRRRWTTAAPRSNTAHWVRSSR